MSLIELRHSWIHSFIHKLIVLPECDPMNISVCLHGSFLKEADNMIYKEIVPWKGCGRWINGHPEYSNVRMCAVMVLKSDCRNCYYCLVFAVWWLHVYITHTLHKYVNITVLTWKSTQNSSSIPSSGRSRYGRQGQLPSRRLAMGRLQNKICNRDISMIVFLSLICTLCQWYHVTMWFN